MGTLQFYQTLVYVHLLLLCLTEGTTRVYYLGIREVEWDYAPSGKNVIMGLNTTEDSEATVFLQQGLNRVGNIYWKAVYKQYTDETYSVEVLKPAWLGFLGPILRAEVGDVISVHLKNFASRPFNIHPHGVSYEKESEGFLYPNMTSGNKKMGGAVSPGQSHVYTWRVTEDHAPTADDPNCLAWVYYSHINMPRDIASGLIGPLVTCKKGVLSGSPLSRRDVAAEFLLMFTVVDENLSWYLDQNIASFCSNPDSVNKEDTAFQESNRMHAINGYIFGNLPELSMCTGEHVTWHLMGMNSEISLHTVSFHGHTLTIKDHMTDVVTLIPATFITAEMIPRNPGTWLLTCQVNDHLKAGMQALYDVKTCHTETPVSESHLTGKLWKYFIAAKEVQWDYGPSGVDKSTGKSLLEPNSHSEMFFKKSHTRLGGKYWKVKYVAYTDETFRVEKKQSEEEKHLGILGPVIKGEVGDTILVMFYNKASRPYSMQPHGVFYGKDLEGTLYSDGLPGRNVSVQPLQRFTYRWTVPPHVGPTESDPPCLTWMYYSAVDPIRDTNAGLVGPLVTCKTGTLHDDGRQKGVDKEFYLLYTIFDENLSWLIDLNIMYAALDRKTAPNDEEFQKSNRMYSMNGFMFSNLPGLEMCRGDRVSWHLLGLGSEMDVHTPLFQGNTVQLGGKRKDSTALFPHVFATVFMQPDQTGTFEISCQTSSHFLDGMKQQYTVSPCRPDAESASWHYEAVRMHYIMAEEVEWDYCPDKSWKLAQRKSSGMESNSRVFVGNEDGLGSQYKKVVYREYVDETFQTPLEGTVDQQHLGILGPLIRAEVGDILIIVFKNNASRPYSVHAHGLLERSSGEVPIAKPGEVVVYLWNVPEQSGPGPADSSCIPWVYYSNVDPVKDVHSGLIGPLVICRKGSLNFNGRRKAVDREFALLFLVFDENQSWYLEENIRNHVNKDLASLDLQDKEFMKSNKMHAINGKLYANLPGLLMHQGERVAWYLLGLGQDIDVHAVHFHSQSFTYMSGRKHRADVLGLFPGTLEVVEMVAGNPGTWLLHCLASDHISAGMEALFMVLPQPEVTVQSLQDEVPLAEVTVQSLQDEVPLAEVTVQSLQDEVPLAAEAKPSESEMDNIQVFGSKMGQREAELVLILVGIGGSILFVACMALIGLVIHLYQQKKLRRQRRSVRDEGIGLLTLKIF